jgi:hypothetical protein
MIVDIVVSSQLAKMSTTHFTFCHTFNNSYYKSLTRVSSTQALYTLDFSGEDGWMVVVAEVIIDESHKRLIIKRAAVDYNMFNVFTGETNVRNADLGFLKNILKKSQGGLPMFTSDLRSMFGEEWSIFLGKHKNSKLPLPLKKHGYSILKQCMWKVEPAAVEDCAYMPWEEIQVSI